MGEEKKKLDQVFGLYRLERIGALALCLVALGALSVTSLLTHSSNGHSKEHLDIAWRVDLNRATAVELMALPGIGPSRARKILKLRAGGADLEKFSTLRKSKGMPAEVLSNLRDYVIVKPD